MKKILLMMTTIFMLVSCASHKEQNSSQGLGQVDMKSYVTPMPHLILFAVQNAKELGLSDQQLKELNQAEEKFHPVGSSHVQKIKKYERAMIKDSKTGKSLKTVMSDFKKSKKHRYALAKMKVETMFKTKKILNSKQWSLLLKKYPEKMPFTVGPNFKAKIHHANPVPNYMGQINKRQDLNLSADQKTKLNKWMKEKSPKMREMVSTIIEKEKALNLFALNNLNEKKILKEYSSILSLREKIVKNKTQCRDYVKATLTSKQWSTLIK